VARAAGGNALVSRKRAAPATARAVLPQPPSRGLNQGNAVRPHHVYRRRRLASARDGRAPTLAPLLPIPQPWLGLRCPLRAIAAAGHGAAYSTQLSHMERLRQILTYL
jgi:hypothetical protein